MMTMTNSRDLKLTDVEVSITAATATGERVTATVERDAIGAVRLGPDVDPIETTAAEAVTRLHAALDASLIQR